MYVNLKGIGKLLFVSVLRIFLISKSAAFTKKLNFPNFVYNFLREKVNFSLIHSTRVNIHSF